MNFAVHAERCAKELTKALETSGHARRTHYERAALHATQAKERARSPVANRIADELVALVEHLGETPTFRPPE